MLTTLEKAVAWAQTKSMWPDTFGLACCAIEMMSIVSARYDIARFGMEAFRVVAAPGRPAHRLRPRRPQDGRAAAADLRPDARAQVGDRDGRLRELRRDVQQLHDAPGRRQDRRRRHPRPRLPAAAGGADGGHRPAPREGASRGSRRRTRSAGSPSDLRGRPRSRPDEGGSTARRRSSSTRRGSSRPACHLRDEVGFNVLADIAATDYLGWPSGPEDVAGYIGTPRGREHHRAGLLGPRAPARAEAEALLDLVPPAPARRTIRRACASRSGSTTGEPVATVIEVWPTADWHEREAYDLMGIVLRGPPEPRAHPDGRRLGGAPAAQGLPDRRRAGPLLGRGVAMAIAPAPRDLRGHRGSRSRSRRCSRSRTTSASAATSSRSTSGRTTPRRTACSASSST